MLSKEDWNDKMDRGIIVMNFLKWVAWILVVCWMGLIFFFSHQPATASSELSSGVTEMIINLLNTVIPPLDIEQKTFGHFVRKGAHFFVYFVLGILLLNALRRSHVDGWKSVFIAFFIAVCYAMTDEIHQLFIPGRSGEVRDVLLDSAGALTGIALYLLITKVFKRK